MNKIKDYNLVCTNLNNRCHLTCVERTGSIVSVFLGKADFLCADPRKATDDWLRLLSQLKVIFLVLALFITEMSTQLKSGSISNSMMRLAIRAGPYRLLRGYILCLF